MRAPRRPPRPSVSPFLCRRACSHCRRQTRKTPALTMPPKRPLKKYFRSGCIDRCRVPVFRCPRKRTSGKKDGPANPRVVGVRQTAKVSSARRSSSRKSRRAAKRRDFPRCSSRLRWEPLPDRETSKSHGACAQGFQSRRNALAEFWARDHYALAIGWLWKVAGNVGSGMSPKENLLLQVLVLKNGDDARRKRPAAFAQSQLRLGIGVPVGKIFWNVPRVVTKPSR